MEVDSRRKQEADDSPMYSRLFVICDRVLTEEDLRNAFAPFGTIEDIRIPLDQNTGRSKGFAFIKFSKASEAAQALASMNFKEVPKSNRRLKIMVATNRSDIQSEDSNTEKYRRLFVVIGKEMCENELEDYFAQFGRVESVLIQRDRNTNESKGLAFVKFRTFLEAALALEKCDKKFRCVFAQPKNTKRPETVFESNINNLASSSITSGTVLISSMNVRPKGYTSINFMCSPYLNQGHIQRLFDIVPGMVSCRYFVDLMNNTGKGTVHYSNPVSAAHALEKIDKLEYPPGNIIFVKPNKFDSNENFDNLPNVVNKLKGAISSSSNTSAPDLAQLADAIAEASKLIKLATEGVNDDSIVESGEIKYCSVPLPPPQPLADIDSPTAKRCFLVCKPQPPPLTALRDVFCRFGNLINVYTLSNKVVGYACYATVESADEAIRVLHGAEVCGIRMKVIEAEEEVPSKRRKYDEYINDKPTDVGKTDSRYNN